MTKSMTAFAHAEGEGHVWEIRSLNHRGLDVRVKLPPALLELESEILDAVRNIAARGKIDVTFRATAAESTASDLAKIDLKNLSEQLTELLAELPTTVVPSVDLLSLLRLAQSNADQLPNEQHEPSQVRASFQEALGKFHAEREREGESLRGVVLEKVTNCRARVAEIQTRSRDQVHQVRENLEEKLETLKTNVDPTRLAQEVALIAQKSDFSEELDRLVIHLDEVETRLSDASPSGRRLNFLVQELGREANTLATKAYSSDTAMRAVDLKVYVDQMREQIQNIE